MTTTTEPPRIHPRLEPIDILRRNNIKSCLWAEDALGFYQVPTVVFELYLLVPDQDLQTASTIVSSHHDYQRVPIPQDEVDLAAFREIFANTLHTDS